MGGGRWDNDSYKSASLLRSSVAKARGVKGVAVDFAYTATPEAQIQKKVHPNLDPLRINRKPFGKLESRDSVEHPESNAIFVCFDVTGSNKARAVDAQKRLPNLMNLLEKYISDPQVLVASNDDYNVEPTRSVQISDYESDNRVDDHIRNIILVGNGGGNMGESYDLMLYAAARKTIIDCMEVRQKKGYLFMYADEPFFDQVDADQVKAVFGDDIKKDIPIKTIIKEAQELYNVFIIWPDGGYIEARDQYIKLFGKENVLTLQSPNLICELIGSVVGINEEKLASGEDAVKDLVDVGMSAKEAKDLVKVAGRVRRKFKFEDDAPAA